jgi:tetratricopeptide (TPR) repeat protein
LEPHFYEKFSKIPLKEIFFQNPIASQREVRILSNKDRYWRKKCMCPKKKRSENEDSTLDPGSSEDPHSFCIQGVEKFNAGNYAEAIDDFNKALMLDPENAEYYNLRGHALFSKGENKSARTDFMKSKKLKAKSKKIKNIPLL